MSLRLPMGYITVLLGPSVGRRRAMSRLDESTGRCGDHPSEVVHLRTRRADPVPARLAALDSTGAAAVVLVDRMTDGLGATDRRTVLVGLRAVAARGTAVLVDDLDPVAALAVADATLRCDVDGDVTEELLYEAS